MNQQSYLIDTNILIGLEDYHKVEAAYARFNQLALAHKVDVFVHEVARKDIARDKDVERREISLSKISKYPELKKQKGLTEGDLARDYGPLAKPNDVVDATLLHALELGAIDFLVSQDKGLHERARVRSAELGRRVLFISDATDLLVQTYEPKKVPIRHIANVQANQIDNKDDFFDSLREDYAEFDDWWKAKCISQRRPCWVLYDDKKIAGLIVRKDEMGLDTDAITPAEKILKICTFKVSPEKRGVKLGELLLKQVLWYAQTNRYDLAYLTTYSNQTALMELLEFYGFEHTGGKGDELIWERGFASTALSRRSNQSAFDSARQSYPRFIFDEETQAFVVPIQEVYHDVLYPDLRELRQPDLFDSLPGANFPTRPGNTIRKVYLCRAQSNLGEPGSLLFFYKGKSRDEPSQALTALGIYENFTMAHSTRELMQLTGGRSVYSEADLANWEASGERPVKVINFLLVSYIDPPIPLDELKHINVSGGVAPQSINEYGGEELAYLVRRANLQFDVGDI